MALIKCAECGKEISNKASACIHCGCPIEVLTKEKNIEKKSKIESRQNESKEIKNNDFIVKSERNQELENFHKLYKKICKIGLIAIGIFLLLTIAIGGIEAILAATVFGGIPLFVFNKICTIIYNNALKTFIQVNEREIYGKVYRFGGFTSVSFPINSVSSISDYQSFFGLVKGVSIVAHNGRTQKIPFLSNGDELRQAVVEQTIKQTK